MLTTKNTNWLTYKKFVSSHIDLNLSLKSKQNSKAKLKEAISNLKYALRQQDANDQHNFLS